MITDCMIQDLKREMIVLKRFFLITNKKEYMDEYCNLYYQVKDLEKQWKVVA